MSESKYQYQETDEGRIPIKFHQNKKAQQTQQRKFGQSINLLPSLAGSKISEFLGDDGYDVISKNVYTNDKGRPLKNDKGKMIEFITSGAYSDNTIPYDDRHQLYIQSDGKIHYTSVVNIDETEIQRVQLRKEGPDCTKKETSEQRELCGKSFTSSMVKIFSDIIDLEKYTVNLQGLLGKGWDPKYGITARILPSIHINDRYDHTKDIFACGFKIIINPKKDDRYHGRFNFNTCERRGRPTVRMPNFAECFTDEFNNILGPKGWKFRVVDSGAYQNTHVTLTKDLDKHTIDKARIADYNFRYPKREALECDELDNGDLRCNTGVSEIIRSTRGYTPVENYFLMAPGFWYDISNKDDLIDLFEVIGKCIYSTNMLTLSFRCDTNDGLKTVTGKMNLLGRKCEIIKFS